jgi:hypothetical protein
MTRPKKQAHPASDEVRLEWLRRVEAEYSSAAITQHLTLWLMQLGASPDLIHGGLRIAGDEIVHAELSFETYTAAGGTQTPALVRERLGLRRIETDPLEADVTRVALNSFCINETVAVPLFKNLREHCTVPVARRVLDRVLKDEVRHRDFGFSLLSWLLELPMGESLRELARQTLPVYFARIREAYGVSIRHLDKIPPDDRAWGLMPPAEYAAIVERTFTRDWLPRFGKLGIDAQRAWDASLAAPAAQ